MERAAGPVLMVWASFPLLLRSARAICFANNKCLTKRHRKVPNPMNQQLAAEAVVADADAVEDADADLPAPRAMLPPRMNLP
jgi:hypothetical protein